MVKDFSLWSRNFVFVCISTFLYFGSFYLLLPTLPQYVADLGGTAAQIGLVTGTFTLMSVIVRPYFGRAVDRKGRKSFMLLGAGLFAALFALYSQIHAVLPLCIVRAAHGVAHGSYLAAAYAYVADLAPVDRRGEVMGVYGVANVVSMAMFPALGSAILSHTGSFSTLFLISMAISAGGFVSILFIDEIKADTGKGRAETSLLDAVKQRAVLVASLALFSAATVYGAVVTFLPVYAPSRGLNNVGIFFSSYAVFTLVSRLVAGKLSDRFGRRKVVIPFLVVVGGAALMLPLLKDVYLLIFIGACYGLGFGAFMPALNAYVVDETPPQQRASALAFFTAFMDVGITTGALVLGIIGQYWGYGIMYMVGGLIVLAGALLFGVAGKTSSSR
jgi:MFS family permease